jgi:hypothetical protein
MTFSLAAAQRGLFDVRGKDCLSAILNWISRFGTFYVAETVAEASRLRLLMHWFASGRGFGFDGLQLTIGTPGGRVQLGLCTLVVLVRRGFDHDLTAERAMRSLFITLIWRG